jgi:hypothetical protein
LSPDLLVSDRREGAVWIDAEEAFYRGIAPLIVLDANGMVVRRLITAFDPETGDVESFVLDRDGRPLVEGPDEDRVRRLEVFPAPLRWQRVTAAQVQAETGRLWDRDGR